MQDLLRLIEIEGVDINPCGGTHLSCTGELQVLKIVGLEKSRGQARLRFMVGGRVLAALGSALTREVALNKVDLLHFEGGACWVAQLPAFGPCSKKQIRP